ncbi:MAG: tyrosine--tRNA ligase [Deltaproteobacteria bacterium]|nr:tyrosine--tRNA ligase [Deltaproteobacteria bacterium]
MSPREQLAVLTSGIVHLEVEAELLARLGRGAPLRVKAGFDPTAPDLHLGHTVLIQKMRQFQELGHEVVFIIGDFTAMIGDPTGKSQTRPPLTREQVDENAETYKRQVFKILDPARTRIELNSAWLGTLTPAEIVQLAARYTVQRMLERNDFKARLESGREIAVHEMLYALFQAYDSVAIRADVELGGQDQLWNLMVGRDIMRRYGLEPQIVMTVPLLEGTDAKLAQGRLAGEKMSKSLGNYVGIDERPEQMYGKLMSISDDLMWRYYQLLSTRSEADLAALRAGHPMEAKHALALEIVARYHGADAAARAEESFRAQFSRRELPEDIAEIRLEVDKPELYRVIARAGLCKSGSEASRLIEKGGVDVDGRRVTDPRTLLERGRTVLVRVGKRRLARVIIE